MSNSTTAFRQTAPRVRANQRTLQHQDHPYNNETPDVVYDWIVAAKTRLSGICKQHKFQLQALCQTHYSLVVKTTHYKATAKAKYSRPRPRPRTLTSMSRPRQRLLGSLQVSFFYKSICRSLAKIFNIFIN